MLKDWDWILFDADDTLFHFDAFAGLQRLFQQYDVQFSRADYDDYQAINKPLWVDYQNGRSAPCSYSINVLRAGPRSWM
ncbi:hypothetical protein ERHA55_44560 [Erwinia rhapontici]|nr:hypothetical protein ERHA55_44560 [Erwinia rhapontici]